jgi:hypothetical protein
MLPLRIPDGDVADHSDVGADELLGTHNPDLGIVGVLGKHHVLAQKLPDAIVSRGQDEKTLVQELELTSSRERAQSSPGLPSGETPRRP